ncbi:MAG: CDP-archaeol synthase [Phycisphaerae bacterium]|jgi:phosphatidate cytidylyltransferase
MLKYRLVFGTLMTAFFAALIIFDGWMDGTLTASAADDKQVQGTIFCILLALMVIPAQLELSKLAKVKNLKIFSPITIIASILFVTTWYWPQLIEISPVIYLSFVSAFSLLGLLLYQYFRCGTSEVLANCGVSYFSIIYLGLLGSFALGIRIDFGPWALLMYIFVIKSADIGAYSIGSIFGRHKFSPVISPGKTWEGMAGAVAAAIIVAILFAVICDIMAWWLAVIFGFCFAFIGQMGDLAESMIKRDAKLKDSASMVPGFGGLLDILDSLLPAAPLAYLFFMLNSL